MLPVYKVIIDIVPASMTFNAFWICVVIKQLFTNLLLLASCLRFDLADHKHISREHNYFIWILRYSQSKDLVYFYGGSEKSLYCILRDRLKNFSLSKHLKNTRSV